MANRIESAASAHRTGMVRKTTVLAVLVACISGLGASEARIEVNAGQAAGYTIPRSIFGTFLEPIGQSIYPGLWAQLLRNPSFEDNLWSVAEVRRMVAQEPALEGSSQIGLPLPWRPLDPDQGVRYEPRWKDAANSFRSLEIMSLPGKETGVRQTVYLPVHRVLRYTGSLYARHLSGPREIDVSLRGHEGLHAVYARRAFPLTGEGWKRYEFALILEPGQVQPLAPADFAITVNNEARVLVDQVFLFPADAVKGMDPDMVAMTRALRTPVIRFGGNFTSGYHWRDGVGPMDQRVTMLNQSWGMPEYNHFGTDEFLDYCRLVGAEPQIALNLGTGTPEEAAGWVRYVNERWGDRRGGLLWELGNELWGTFQIGYPTIERIAARTKAFSDAVRRVDPTARLIATGADPDRFQEWNQAQLGLQPGTFAYLATHFVVRDDKVVRKDASPEFLAQASFALPVGLERQLRLMKGQIDAHTEWRTPPRIAFTEWLFHGPNDGVPRFTNMGGAICAAGMLNTLMRVADFTPISDMTGVVEFGGIWKKRGRVFGVPAYWAFRMYSNAGASRPVKLTADVEKYDVTEGNQRIPEIRDVPYLDVVAALDESGRRLILFCVNRNTRDAIQGRIHVSGFESLPEATVETLQSGAVADGNSEERPDAIVPVRKPLKITAPEFVHSFAPLSVSVIELQRR